MTTDPQLASDLICLGAENRRGLLDLDDALRRTNRVAPTADVSLLAAAGVLTDRLARLAGGAVAALGAIMAVIALHRPAPLNPVTLSRPTGSASLGELVDQWLFLWVRDRLTLATTMLLAILAAQQLARHLAGRWITGQLTTGDPVARVRRLARGVDAWSAGLGAGGVAALGALFSVASLAAGRTFWTFFELHG
ncbi:MAG TPA: hypothetical protein VGC42_03670, partial [Kofleriaceae bacterium]